MRTSSEEPPIFGDSLRVVGSASIVEPDVPASDEEHKHRDNYPPGLLWTKRRGGQLAALCGQAHALDYPPVVARDESGPRYSEGPR
jgi:hypothetical protein